MKVDHLFNQKLLSHVLYELIKLIDNSLTPIRYISGISGSVISGKKSKIYFSVLDDVIHDRYFMTSYASITTPVTLTIRHMK